MNRNEILQRMESLNGEIDALGKQKTEADEAKAGVIGDMIAAKTAEFDKLTAQVEELDAAEARKAAMDAVKAKTNKIADVNAPEVKVPDSDHNEGNHEREHGKAILAYATHRESGTKAKNEMARERGDNFVNAISTENGIKLTASMANYIAPRPTAVTELEQEMGKSAEDMFGKAVVLVRDASGTNSGGGSSVNVDFEPTLFKVPKRNNAIPQKCWVKRGVGKQAQYPKLTQSTNQYGVAATWGNAGADNGEGVALTQSDPVQTQVTVNMERLGLLTAVSKRYLRNNDVNFLSELAWMFRGTVDFQLGRAILQGVQSGGTALTNAPVGINTNAGIALGVVKQARETASQVSYVDLVKMQFRVDDGIFGTGEYIISATNTGAMQYIASLDDSSGRPIFGGDSQSGWGVAGPSVIAGMPFTNSKENSKPVGERGDVIYGNFRGYGLAVDGDEMAIERSDDYGFNTGQVYFRLIMYAGGTVIGGEMFCLLDDPSGVSSSSSSSST